MPTGHLRRVLGVALCVSGLLLSGCNLFSKLHRDGVETNASVLVADGKAALARGDYANAGEYFRLAIASDPTNAEARAGYAEAYLKNIGFNLGQFMQTFIHQLEDNGGGGTMDWVNPADWGQTDMAGVKSALDTLIDTLDPIAQGETVGGYRASDVGINLNLGFFYTLRVAATVQEVSAAYEIQELSKSATSAAALGISQAEFDLLPEDFWWIAGNPPSMVLNQIESDISAGTARLQTAAANSSSADLITPLIDLLEGLSVQVQP